jgi:hypothetical protein
MIFRQMALNRHKLLNAPAQAGDALILAAGHDDQSVWRHAIRRLGDAQFILPTMTASQNKSRFKSIAFGLRSNAEAGRLQGAKIRPEALDEMKLGIEACGRAKARLGTEKQNALAFSRLGKSLSLEWMKKRLQRLSRHCHVL